MHGDDSTQGAIAPEDRPATGSSTPVQGLLWALLAAVILGVAGFALWWWLAPPPAELPVVATVPEFTLVDRDGQPFGRGDLSGAPWVADFIFTRCAAICPRMTRQMSGVAEALAGTPIEIVSISVDPEHDTPEVLDAWARQFGAGESWHFLTGENEAIYDLARKGFLLAVDPSPPAELEAENGPIVHSTRFVLVDSEGQIRGYYDAFEQASVERLVADARRLLR